MGHLAGIFVAAAKAEAPCSLEGVRLLAQRGLEGDRYAAEAGTFSGRGAAGPGRAVSLIESEHVEEAARELGAPLDAASLRRNLLTTGVRLLDLIGRDFRIGAARLRGIRTCPPCGHLSRLIGIDAKRVLVRRGGIRAEVVEGGRIRVGDCIEVLKAGSRTRARSDSPQGEA